MPYTTMTAKEIQEKYPFKDLPGNFIGLFAPDNGCINLPLLLRSLYRLCLAYGARLVEHAEVTKIVSTAEGVKVHTLEGTPVQARSYPSAKVAITAGAYTNQVLRSLGLRLDLNIWEMASAYYAVDPGPNGTVFPSMWFQFKEDDDKDPTKSNLYYGFPALPWGPANLCRIAVDTAHRVISDPSERRSGPSEEDLARTQQFVAKHVRGAASQAAFAGSCLQTNVFDNMFVLDHLPESYVTGGKNIVVFTAGWAMKFVPLLGRVIKEMLFGELEKKEPNVASIVASHFKIDRIDPQTSLPLLRKLPPRAVVSAAMITITPIAPLRSGSSISHLHSKAVTASGRPPAALVAPPRHAFSRGQFARQLLALQPGIADPATAQPTSTRLSAAMIGVSPTPPRTIRVGILGAGMAGLYAALLLKDLAPRLNHVKFEWEILEAAGRAGGRVYTYRFDANKWKKSAPDTADFYDYFDVGAMRFPLLDTMKRVVSKSEAEPSWSLVNYLNKTLSEANRSLPQGRIELAPYLLSDDKRNGLLYYNGKRLFQSEKLEDDALHFGIQNGGLVPTAYAARHYNDWLLPVYGPILSSMTEDFNAGFNSLLAHDRFSTRGYLQTNPTPAVSYLAATQYGYPESVVTWCETMDSASGLYDEAFTESVMDAFDFSAVPDSDWRLVKGGTERIVDGMLAVLALPDNRPTEEAQETAVAEATKKNSNKKRQHGEERREVKKPSKESTPETSGILLKKRVTKIAPTPARTGISVTVADEPTARVYHHVISTLPLSVLRSVDTAECNLSYGKRVALRTLHYDNSVKVALKFNTRWWQDPQKMDNKPIIGGKSSTDLPIRTVVYPSYGIHVPEAPGVLIVSYTWAQDAARLGAFASPTLGREAEERVVELCLHDLEILHGKVVREEYTKQFYFYDWYNHAESQGAFALFGPGQFTSLYPSLVAPEAGGYLHVAGEATSVHHAWIVGSLNSAYRAVWQLLEKEGLEEAKAALVERWGTIDEVEYGGRFVAQPTPQATAPTAAAMRATTAIGGPGRTHGVASFKRV